MNSKKYFTIGLWIFVILTVSVLAVLRAAQTGFTVMLFGCSAISLISSVGFLVVLLQSKKTIENLSSTIQRLKEREEAHVHKNQHTTEENQQQTDVFHIDEAVKHIMPTAETQFNSVETYCEKLLQNIAKETGIVQGLIFVLSDADNKFNISGQYAYYSETQPQGFMLGENLSGQVAKNKEMLNLKELPAGYITIISGLGKSAPHNLIIAPIVYNDNSIGVMELASFKTLGVNEEGLVRKICELMANQLNDLRTKV